MTTKNLTFSEILSDLSKKYIINEKIEPREFIQKLCKCQNEQFDQFNNSSRLVKKINSLASSVVRDSLLLVVFLYHDKIVGRMIPHNIIRFFFIFCRLSKVNHLVFQSIHDLLIYFWVRKVQTVSELRTMAWRPIQVIRKVYDLKTESIRSFSGKYTIFWFWTIRSFCWVEYDQEVFKEKNDRLLYENDRILLLMIVFAQSWSYTFERSHSLHDRFFRQDC